MKIIKLFLAVFVVLQLSVFGQTGSSYSRIGIGDPVYSYSAYGIGIGGLAVSVSNPTFFDLSNPASWNQINRTRFSIGMIYSGSFLSGSQSYGFNGKAKFNGIALAFPVSDSNGATISMGIVPYSTVNYNVKEAGTDLVQSSGSYEIIYKGSGGLSKAYIGTSYRLPFDVSLGATLNYYFGSVTYEATSQFLNSDASNSSYTRTYNLNGLGANVGVISPDFSGILNSKGISNLRIGVSAEFLGNINADTLYTSTTTSRTDTMTQAPVNMKIPYRLMAGLSFSISQKYTLTFDAATQNWSNYSFNDAKYSDLRNATKLSAGMQYRPRLEAGMTTWQQIVWRCGFSYEMTQYKVNGTGINQYSVAGGFSFPISQGNTLDFALIYGVTGTSNPDLIKENFVKVNVGLSLGELWFVRRDD